MAGKKYWKISRVVMVITSENIGFITSGETLIKVCAMSRSAKEHHSSRHLCGSYAVLGKSALGKLVFKNDLTYLLHVLIMYSAKLWQLFDTEKCLYYLVITCWYTT